jgi:hypothetical protein
MPSIRHCRRQKSEEFDKNNNPVINPENIDRGANHLAEGQTAESLTAREKI